MRNIEEGLKKEREESQKRKKDEELAKRLEEEKKQLLEETKLSENLDLDKAEFIKVRDIFCKIFYYSLYRKLKKKKLIFKIQQFYRRNLKS